MPKRLRTGMEVRVTFLDHVEDGDAPYEFVCWGRIVDVGRKSITLRCWDFADPDKFDDKCNVKDFVIVRSAITDLARIKY